MQKTQNNTKQVTIQNNEKMNRVDSLVIKSFEKIESSKTDALAACILYFVHNTIGVDTKDAESALFDVQKNLNTLIKESTIKKGLSWETLRGSRTRISQAAKRFCMDRLESINELTTKESILKVLKKEKISIYSLTEKNGRDEKKQAIEKITSHTPNPVATNPTPVATNPTPVVKKESKLAEPLSINKADSAELMDLIESAIKKLDEKNALKFLNSRLAKLGYALHGLTKDKESRIRVAA